VIIISSKFRGYTLVSEGIHVYRRVPKITKLTKAPKKSLDIPLNPKISVDLRNNRGFCEFSAQGDISRSEGGSLGF